jgi:hypothetical protein
VAVDLHHERRARIPRSSIGSPAESTMGLEGALRAASGVTIVTAS